MSCALKNTVCHGDLSFAEGSTVIGSNLILYDGTNCNVHEVVTVIDLYICIGPIYISVIHFWLSLNQWCHVRTRMLCPAHQAVCMYRVPSMIMTFWGNIVICIMWPPCVTFKLLHKQHLFFFVCFVLFYWLWFNSCSEDSQHFGEDSISITLLSINGYLFFLHWTRERRGKGWGPGWGRNEGTAQVWDIAPNH